MRTLPPSSVSAPFYGYLKLKLHRSEESRSRRSRQTLESPRTEPGNSSSIKASKSNVFFKFFCPGAHSDILLTQGGPRDIFGSERLAKRDFFGSINPRRHKVKKVTRRHKEGGGGLIGPLPSTFDTIHLID